MRYVNQNYETIDESEVDLSQGYVFQNTIIKEDAIEPDNITKFAYDDDEYEEVNIYVRVPQREQIQQEIQERKNYLTDTDYAIIKIAEGSATPGEYEDVIARRKLAREQINEYERQLELLGDDI